MDNRAWLLVIILVGMLVVSFVSVERSGLRLNSNDFQFGPGDFGSGNRGQALSVPYCGNSVQEIGEECDLADDAACPALCNDDCECGIAPTFELNIVVQGYDDAYAVLQTGDGNYLIGGRTTSTYGGAWAAYLRKINVNGDLIWERIYDEPGDIGRIVFDFQETSDQGFILVGEAMGSQYWIAKTDEEGIIQDQNTFGGSSLEFARGIKQTDDGGFVIVGQTQSYGNGVNEIWAVKTNSDLDTCDFTTNDGVCSDTTMGTFARTFGGPGNDIGRDIIQTSDGGYAIVGEIWDPNYNYEATLIKLNEFGDQEWAQTYGGPNYDDDVGVSVHETSDQGFIIGGFSSSINPSRDVWLIKTDSMGITCDYGSTGNCDDPSTGRYAKIIGGDGIDQLQSLAISPVGYVFTGRITSFGIGQTWVVSVGQDLEPCDFSATGECSDGEIFAYRFAKDDGGFNTGDDIVTTYDGGYIVAGRTAEAPLPAIEPAIKVVRLDSSGCVIGVNC